MPFCKFIKPYPGYTVGQVVDLPGKLSYKLRDAGVVVKVDAPVFAPVKPPTTKAAVKRASKKK